MGVHPAETRLPAGVLVSRGAATELDRLRKLEAFNLPRKALAQPRVRILYLESVLDALVEHAVVVANAVTDNRQRQGRAAVEETGREAAEATVTKTGIEFPVVDVLEVEADAIQSLCRLFLNP